MTPAAVCAILTDLGYAVTDIEPARYGGWTVNLADDAGLSASALKNRFAKTDRLRLAVVGCVCPEQYFVMVEEREEND